MAVLNSFFFFSFFALQRIISKLVREIATLKKVLSQQADQIKTLSQLQEIVEAQSREIASLKQQVNQLQSRQSTSINLSQEETLVQENLSQDLSQETPVQQRQQEWTQVKVGRPRKSYKEAAQHPQARSNQHSSNQPANKASVAKKLPENSLKSCLLPTLSHDEKFNLLFRQPKLPQNKTTEIGKLTLSLPLTMKARSQPGLAWKEALVVLTGQRPLAVSLLNPGKGEVFYDAKVLDSIREHLTVYQQDNLEIGEKDLIRRKHLYLKGFFLPLRRAALQDFSEELQLKLLDLAEQDLNKMPDPNRRKQWKFQINKDRCWIQNTEMAN